MEVLIIGCTEKLVVAKCLWFPSGGSGRVEWESRLATREHLGGILNQEEPQLGEELELSEIRHEAAPQHWWFGVTLGYGLSMWSQVENRLKENGLEPRPQMQVYLGGSHSSRSRLVSMAWTSFLNRIAGDLQQSLIFWNPKWQWRPGGFRGPFSERYFSIGGWLNQPTYVTQFSLMKGT